MAERERDTVGPHRVCVPSAFEGDGTTSLVVHELDE